MEHHKAGKCRFCATRLDHTFVDLGMSPLCESFVKADDLNKPEVFYPLHVYVCSNCFLVQVEEFVSPREIYSDYAYFSSYSDSWLAHSKKYVNDMVDRFGFDENSLVAEIASNDGYLLQYFLEKRIPVLGIEPSHHVAAAALKKGVRTVSEFFGASTMPELVAGYGKADLLLGNNVLAHVPDINDFVAGMKGFLKESGLITMEFPHLIRLVEGNQYDTIYHEHFSYLSLTTVDRIFDKHGLCIFDVEELPTHGGSIRIYARHINHRKAQRTGRVKEMLVKENSAGVNSLKYYTGFGERVAETKRQLLEFLIGARRAGKSVVGYGAPGKGNTLLNYCGIRTDFVEYTVDRNPMKHGKYLPGTRIPIFNPEKILQTRPDYVFILPWNLRDEIMEQLTYIGEWGGRFVVPIPELKVYKPSAVAVSEA